MSGKQGFWRGMCYTSKVSGEACVTQGMPPKVHDSATLNEAANRECIALHCIALQSSH